MHLFRILRALTVCIASLLLAYLLMYLGYLFYIPEFGSYIDLYYEMVMRIQFILVAFACSWLVFLAGKYLGQYLITSFAIYIASGSVFALYRPEVGQYHWGKSLYEFWIYYFTVGVIALFFAMLIRKRKLKNNS